MRALARCIDGFLCRVSRCELSTRIRRHSVLAWNEYTYSASGGAYKFVVCEKCKQKYVYCMVRSGDGQGTSLYFLDNSGAQRRAEDQAHAVLQHRLKAECDPVPCPKCGWYQKDMVAKLRRDYQPWLYWTGILASFAGTLCAALGYPMLSYDYRFYASILFIAAFLGVGGGMTAFFCRSRGAARFEPNAIPVKDRLRIANERAEMVTNFEKWLEEQEADNHDPSIESASE